MRNTKNYIKNWNNPFLKMDSESRYWLGYIFADGHIVYDKRRYNVSLFSKNLEIMQKFQQFIGDKAHLYIRPTGIVQVSYNSKPTVEWFVNFLHISNKKSITLNPNIDLDWDILRGYFDGDGSIRLTKQRGKYFRYEAKFTTGSEIWKNRLVSFLNLEGIKTKVDIKGSAFDINIRNKSNLKKFYYKLYSNETSKLEYKYNQFVALFGNKQ